MQAIRIIKGGVGLNRKGLPANQNEKTERQLDREMANTVKGWAAEWEARNRLVQAAAFSLVRSLENRRQELAATVRVVNCERQTCER